MKNRFKISAKKLLSVGMCFVLCMTMCFAMTFKTSAAAVALSTKTLGSIVKIKENGVLQEFYVSKHGYPTAGNGRTLLVRRYVNDTRQFHSSNVNAYASSTIDSWLTGTYLTLLPSDIQGQIAAVSIPYTPGNGNNVVSNLSRKVFLLSATELGHTDTYAKVEGAELAIAATLRKVTGSGGSLQTQWTRSPRTDGTTKAWRTSANDAASMNYNDCTLIYGARPAFTLPSSLWVLDDGTLAVNISPTTPPSITVPTPITFNQAFTVSWGESTDANGNLAGYRLERQINGDEWIQIYQGTATSKSETLALNEADTVAYRVKAYDTPGLESAYITSATRTVINNTAPTPPGAIMSPTSVDKWQTNTINYSWGLSTDSDGDAITYIVEYAINDSSTFTQIASTTATLYSLVIPDSNPSCIQLRVKAKDSSGGESAYSISDWTTINYESQPPADSDKLSVYLDAGDKVKLCVTDDIGDNIDFTWSSDDDSVATVNARGVVTGVSAGLCNITAHDSSGFLQSISIRVEGSESGGEIVYAKVNDDDTKIVYGGIWLPYSGDAAFYNGDEHYSNEVNAYAEFSFNGTAIRWIGANNLDNGKCDVYVDGVLEVQGLDLYSSSLETQKILFSKSGLANKEHTIKVVVTGEKNDSSADCYVTIDAFEYDSQV